MQVVWELGKGLSDRVTLDQDQAEPQIEVPIQNLLYGILEAEC